MSSPAVPAHLIRPDAPPRPGAGDGIDWGQLLAVPAFAEFHLLVRRLFGLSIALISPDARRGGLLGPDGDAPPFCRALQARPGGLARCQACDAEYAARARQSGQPLRYTCHAGLDEFIIPVVVGREVVALLQCGRVLEREPGPEDWGQVKKRLAWAGEDLQDLASAFSQTRVLATTTQDDLVALLKLIAHHIATTHAQKLLLEQAPQDRLVARALAHLEEHYSDPLSTDRVGAAVGASRRTLTRLLRVHTGASLVEHVQRLRLAHACDLLGRTDAKITAVALASGFGSVQQFNRVFRGRLGMTPAAWRAKAGPDPGAPIP